MENVLILKGKNQAFLEMEGVDNASNLFNYYSTNQATIRGRPVYFQFSNRDEITTPQPQPNNVFFFSFENILTFLFSI